jgi:hypothetical protein
VANYLFTDISIYPFVLLISSVAALLRISRSVLVAK